MTVAIRVSFTPCKKHCCFKENGFPRRFAPRNDSGCLGRLFLFHSACVVTLATPSALRATSPKRGSATRQNFPLGAPYRGAVAQATEGSPRWAVPIGKRQVRAQPPLFIAPQVLFNLITPPYHAKGDSHGTDSRRPDHRRDAPHRLAALDADRGCRRRWLGSGLSSRSCKTASFTA